MKLQKESEVRRAQSEGKEKPQEESAARHAKPEVADHHQRPQAQDSPTQAQGSRTGDAAVAATTVAPAVTPVQSQNSKADDGAEENSRKNEGASGYVEENTGSSLVDGGTTPPQYIMQAEDEGNLGGTL
jgi:hypothetical protein